jgi:hypothetical protein
VKSSLSLIFPSGAGFDFFFLFIWSRFKYMQCDSWSLLILIPHRMKSMPLCPNLRHVFLCFPMHRVLDLDTRHFLQLYFERKKNNLSLTSERERERERAPVSSVGKFSKSSELICPFLQKCRFVPHSFRKFLAHSSVANAW